MDGEDQCCLMLEVRQKERGTEGKKRLRDLLGGYKERPDTTSNPLVDSGLASRPLIQVPDTFSLGVACRQRDKPW